MEHLAPDIFELTEYERDFAARAVRALRAKESLTATSKRKITQNQVIDAMCASAHEYEQSLALFPNTALEARKDALNAGISLMLGLMVNASDIREILEEEGKRYNASRKKVRA